MATLEIYRRSTIGTCLGNSLDELVMNGTLKPEIAINVLIQFDKSIAEALKTRVNNTVTMKGHLHTYRFCDSVWTFELRNALIKCRGLDGKFERVKIIAMDGNLLQQ